MNLKFDKKYLERLYHRYNRREYVHPDPLEFLYDYKDLKDREIVGLIASSLAYGRVNIILKSVSYILDKTGPAPAEFLKSASSEDLRVMFADFRHRFATGHHISAMLTRAGQLITEYGSLYPCFLEGLGKDDETVLPALTAFAGKLVGNGACGHLIPIPEKGSACKRLNLFLRWMVRKDAVDPGGWDKVSPSKLIMPIDVHIHRICLGAGLTSRKQANMRTALEITSVFRRMVPDDPVRYDFTLSRLGIRDDISA